MEPVNLTAGEGLVPLPSVEPPSSSAPDGKGAAPAPPLMELAAADVKPGTPPPTIPAPAPAPAPEAHAPTEKPVPGAAAARPGIGLRLRRGRSAVSEPG